MQTELNQGEDYDEYGFEDEEAEYDDEASENTSSGGDMIFGIPKNFFFIGVAALVVVIILIIVVAIWRGRDDDGGALGGSDTGYADDGSGYVDDGSGYVDDGSGYVDDGAVGLTPIYDASGNLIGNADGTTDGALVMDSQDAVIGILDSTGVDVYDASGNLISKYLANDSNSNVTEDSNSEGNSLTQDDVILKLRKLGYTGDEIQAALDNGLDINKLVEEGEKIQDEAAVEALKRMSNSASKEFKQIVNDSIYCMPAGTFTPSPYGEVTSVNLKDSYVVNADYDKLPVYGLQLFLKCKIANNTYLFYSVEPERWEKLPESGNIVLQVDYQLYGTNDSTGVYITNVTEIAATDITVNPQDSGSSMEDILNQGVLGEMEQTQAEEQLNDVGSYDDAYSEEGQY